MFELFLCQFYPRLELFTRGVHHSGYCHRFPVTPALPPIVLRYDTPPSARYSYEDCRLSNQNQNQNQYNFPCRCWGPSCATDETTHKTAKLEYIASEICRLIVTVFVNAYTFVYCTRLFSWYLILSWAEHCPLSGLCQQVPARVPVCLTGVKILNSLTGLRIQFTELIGER